MLQLQNNPQNGNYIPTCTGESDLLYDEVQCHRLSQFCWCVNPETGVPILGTSKYNAKPDCSRKNFTLNADNREIKGKKKAKFFQRLFSSLISDWILTVGEDLVDNSVTNKDKAVHWKFEQLDVNKNGLLERKEWKGYRNEIKLFNRVRKCGRNFMRFCDVDGNRRITLNEWINCTINGRTKIKFPRKNPFLDILRPEDD
ncbi:unnamed protein product [Dracunculus medinensis]|uniref:Thyroglobulin type-1 domain-containing protein n=1 Tax=Dracunculus medinensis TaxID=318479 RepID=A0A158Q4K6_DRAME|nr:unnamed protein product [Dracunculus medinensis]